MRTRSILAIFVWAVPSTAFCQTIASDHQSHIDRRSAYLALGVDDPGHLFGEVGMSWVMEGVHTERSYRLGVEYANDQGHQIFGVKGGIQLNAVILCFRGSIAVYYDGIHLDPRIFPEIGVISSCFRRPSVGVYPSWTARSIRFRSGGEHFLWTWTGCCRKRTRSPTVPRSRISDL